MKTLSWILAISIVFNLLGLVFAYKYLKSKRQAARVTRILIQTREEINSRFRKQLLFIHHSVGQNWLHEGGLKDSLEKSGVGVHNATYGSDIGQNTDMSDWAGKFERYFDKMLKYDIAPDILYPGDRENDIIMFKPCFPNSDIEAKGSPPGNPYAKERTIWNYKAVFENLAERFSKEPEKLFIYITAPPLVPGATTEENARRAREFNNWIKNDFMVAYRERTGLENLYVFDLFDILADSGNCLKPPYRRSETNSHPNVAGSREATLHFMQFLYENGILPAAEGGNADSQLSESL